MIEMKEQCFGVEIEMTGVTREEAAHALADYFGTTPEYWEHIYGSWIVKDPAGKEWKLMSDSSIHPECQSADGYLQLDKDSAEGMPYKVEIVTPKLAYGDLSLLQECMRRMTAIGAKVNDSCGLHVHVDASAHNRQSLKNLIGIMYSKEVTRHVIVPALRDLYPDHETEVLINPSGRFVLGGFEADTGLTGRKLMVDTYGGLVPHGGGALSGKDASKVDRSGTYMARYVAKNIVAAGLAERCTVGLAYAIGRAEPVAVDIDLHETGRYPEAVLEQAVRQVFDLTPGGIIRALGLDRPIFARYCNYGHFTHQDAPWEQTNRAAALAEACEREAR